MKNQSNLNEPNNCIILAFDILRNSLGPYIEDKIRIIYKNNDDWVNILYRDTQISLSDLLIPNCFLQRTNLQKIFTLFLQQWDYVFNKLCFNYVPVNLVNVLSINLEQLGNGYCFSFREVYKILDLGEYLLEYLQLSTNDIVFLRSHALCLLGIEEMSVQKNQLFKKDSNVEMASFYEYDKFGNIKLATSYLNARGQALTNLYQKYS